MLSVGRRQSELLARHGRSKEQLDVLERLAGAETVAFVGGMDLVEDHFDEPPHGHKTWLDGSPWGWHDVGVRLRGEAVRGVWENFRWRWQEAARLRRTA